jgi:hypothetical protein
MNRIMNEISGKINTVNSTSLLKYIKENSDFPGKG